MNNVPSMKIITFSATKKLESEPLSADSYSADKARAYFQSEEALMTLLSDAELVKRISDSKYKAVLPIGSFPGIKVTSENIFAVDRSDSLTIELISSKSTATGPQFLVNIFEASQAKPPKTESLNKITVLEGSGGVCCLQSDVSLKIEMDMPNWIPIPLSILENRGSDALNKLLDADVAPKIALLRDNLASFSG